MMPSTKSEMDVQTTSKVVCIGDIHGYTNRISQLWKILEPRLDDDTAVIFLGDYCDRGPNTKSTLEWLVNLKESRSRNTYFLAGNHDFAMAAFLGLLPQADSLAYKSTWVDYTPRRQGERTGWWAGEGFEHMHLQGRRWAAKFHNKDDDATSDSIYNARPTFESYGVSHGDRQGLLDAMPESHKQFLRDLVWVHEEETTFGKVVAVHAGLTDAPLEDQLSMLRSRDCSIRRHEQLCGRDAVIATPDVLAQENGIVVSGHHGFVKLLDNRVIVDESGGKQNQPLTAIVLPERDLISTQVTRCDLI